MNPLWKHACSTTFPPPLPSLPLTFLVSVVALFCPALLLCLTQRLLQHKVAQHYLLQTSTVMVAGTPRVVAKRPDKLLGSSSSSKKGSSEVSWRLGWGVCGGGLKGVRGGEWQAHPVWWLNDLTNC